MNQGTSVFSQILSFVDYEDFRRCVRRYEGDRGVRRLSCWEQFLAMAFAQLTRREGLRDIEVSLAAHRHQLYHSGFRSPVKKSTLADANETRNWKIYSDFAQHLIQQARPLVDVFPREEQEIFLQHALNVGFAETPADGAAMFVVDDAGRLIEILPASFPRLIAQIGVLEIERRQQFIEASELQKLSAVIGA